MSSAAALSAFLSVARAAEREQRRDRKKGETNGSRAVVFLSVSLLSLFSLSSPLSPSPPPLSLSRMKIRSLAHPCDVLEHFYPVSLRTSGYGGRTGSLARSKLRIAALPPLPSQYAPRLGRLSLPQIEAVTPPFYIDGTSKLILAFDLSSVNTSDVVTNGARPARATWPASMQRGARAPVDTYRACWLTHNPLHDSSPPAEIRIPLNRNTAPVTPVPLTTRVRTASPVRPRRSPCCFAQPLIATVSLAQCLAAQADVGSLFADPYGQERFPLWSSVGPVVENDYCTPSSRVGPVPLSPPPPPPPPPRHRRAAPRQSIARPACLLRLSGRL